VSLTNHLHLLISLPALRATDDMAHQSVIIPRAPAFPSQLLKLLEVEALAFGRLLAEIISQFLIQTRTGRKIRCFTLHAGKPPDQEMN
jgi:hypothetical protein